jgi:hypothetical protein
VLTHLDLRITPLRHTLPEREPCDPLLQARWPEGRWVSRAELPAFGLPAPIARLVGKSDELFAAQELVDQRQPL